MAEASDTASRPPSGPHDLIVTALQMRAAEQALFDRGTDSFALMRSAGEAVADHVMQSWPDRAVVVLCGPGNNGGDGFIAAEALRQKGRRVALLAMRPAADYRDDSAKAAAAWQGSTHPFEPATLENAITPESIVVDGMFGIGLDRPLEGTALAAIARCEQAACPVVAIDMPSGISSDTGFALGAAITASDTMTFGWPKPGHLLLPGRLHTGRLLVAPLAFDAASGSDGCRAAAGSDLRANGPAAWLLKLPRPGLLDHKYSRGHALVLGSAVMPGAGRLAAHAARRIGAGMLTVAAPAGTLPLFMADQPGIIAKPVETPEDLVEILLDSRISGVLVGSGMLPDDPTREAVLNVLAAGRPAVIDGGGLTVFADKPQELFALGRSDIVLTPHEGEFGRLFPDLDPTLGKLERARQAAARSGMCIVLKGADTVIAEPPGLDLDQPGRIIINHEASPHLATAGAGDVLAGIVLGLLAQGMAPFDAAAAAVWFHSEAGFAAGPGLIAEDLSGQIPGILRLIENAQ